ncbi:MAG TPA: class F sortase [Streptosporangiaceae bacterium]
MAGDATDPAAGLRVQAGKPRTPIGLTACLVAAGLVVAGVGVAGLLTTQHHATATRAAALAASLPAPTGRIAASPQAADSRLVATPVRLTVPVIGVNTTLIRLGLAASGVLQVPSSASVAGWYTGSPRPGAIGPAVIVGHIDSRTGPGVFYRLGSLRKGNKAYVRRADGTLVVFRVTRIETYLKSAFPTHAVYDPTPDPELRLITCGGTFDAAAGTYLSNVIAFAVEEPG